MIVYILVNYEAGWDCIAGVYTTEVDAIEASITYGINIEDDGAIIMKEVEGFIE